MSHTRNGKGQTEFDPATPQRINPLIRAIHAHEPDPILCAECRHHMADLYHLQRTERPLSAKYLLYQAHFEACSDCQLEFTALCEVLDEFEAGTLPDVAQPPTFDLSFMDSIVDGASPRPISSPISPPTLWLSALAADLHNLVSEVIVMVERTKATFEQLAWLPKITLIPSPNLRHDTHTGTNAGTNTGQAELLVLPAPDADLSLHLSVGPVVAGAAAIAVKLSELSSGRPLGETRVTLRNGQRQLLIGSVTNQEGMTIFEQLPLGRYFIQVRHSQQTWEIPLVLVEGTLAVGAQPAS